MNVVTLCGSLRASSSNATLLAAAALVAPAGVTFERYEGLASLPPFNPDVEEDAIGDDRRLPAPVQALRAQVENADALLISCPEYAHGVPGTFKNALDWLVGSTRFAGTPVTLLNSSAHATHAQAQLREVLTTMVRISAKPIAHFGPKRSRVSVQVDQ